jgi:Flp pilus assembly protein TadG
MTLKWRLKRKSGQGLVEFALVLPLLLLLLLGMAEFARIFAIYSNLFNAAREGARYGIVYPTDTAGILYAARQRVSLVRVADVTFTVTYDSGPGTATKDTSSLRDGDRVLVNAYYDVEPMLPLLRPLLQSLYVDTTSARTIARLGGLPPAVPGPGLPGPSAAAVVKTANPASVPESGANVTFSILINNTGEQDVTLTSLVDDVFGNLNGQGDCATGGTIPVGGSYPCSFTVFLSSPTLADHVDKVTATLEDAYLGTVTPFDTALVTFTDEEGTISIAKTANPTSVPETGGNVTFGFTVQNTGLVSVTLGSLTDSTLGDLNGKGSCVTGGIVPAGGSYSCSVMSVVSGIGESQHMNRAIAVATDAQGHVVEAASSTATVLFTLSANPIRITIPLMAGAPTLRGTAHPGETVTLRDLQNASLSMSTVVAGDGSFSFNVSGGLVGGHVMVVEGYGREDWALVEVLATPTPAPTPTPLPMDISLDPECGAPGEDPLTVYGYDWPATEVRIDHSFGGVTNTLITLPWDAHQTFFTIGVLTITEALTGAHTIQSYEHRPSGQWVPQDSEIFTVPCPPGPGYPNLVVQDVTIGSSGPISTYEPITLTATIANTGATTATHVFWAELYLDQQEPISSTMPSEDYMAIAPLGVGQVTTAVLGLPEGISVSGTHTVSVMADTWNQVSESSEADNVSQPATMTIVSRPIFPGMTPTPTPLPGGKGSVSGSTWLYLGGYLAPQGRVLVSVYTAGGDLVAQGVSDRSGQYLLDSVPAGTFNMFAELYVDGELYIDILTNVEVKNNQLTAYQTLLLH